MRVVLDTNVFVSAAITPTGVSAQVVSRGLEHDYQLVVSPRLLAEIQAVLARPKFERLITADELEHFLLDVRAGSDSVGDPDDVPAATRDPKDDYLVALARSARADLLVSGDPDLHAEEEQRPPVVSPRELLTRLGDA